MRPVVHHIPVCPFSQRLEILLALKGQREAVEFRVVDITRPREPELLKRTRGTTALPVMETDRGLLKESLVILRYLDETVPGPRIAREDPYERAVENMMVAMEGDFTGAGYRFVMNQERDKRDGLRDTLIAQYAKLDDFLNWQNANGVYLFERFGLAETVFTPMFMRFWFVEYYESFELPSDRFPRLARWREACLAERSAQQVSREEIVKLYYDYALGYGNGALPKGRSVSSFALKPHWSKRPMPPRGKWGEAASDRSLGLL